MMQATGNNPYSFRLSWVLFNGKEGETAPNGVTGRSRRYWRRPRGRGSNSNGNPRAPAPVAVVEGCLDIQQVGCDVREDSSSV